MAIIAAAFGILATVLGFASATLDRDNTSPNSDRAALISATEELELQLVTANEFHGRTNERALWCRWARPVR
ncbi:exported protein of unknown function [Agreia sp. COWG]|nr:exported protein of unknown function [Agreia sp. COWG]